MTVADPVTPLEADEMLAGHILAMKRQIQELRWYVLALSVALAVHSILEVWL